MSANSRVVTYARRGAPGRVLTGRRAVRRAEGSWGACTSTSESDKNASHREGYRAETTTRSRISAVTVKSGDSGSAVVDFVSFSKIFLAARVRGPVTNVESTEIPVVILCDAVVPKRVRGAMMTMELRTRVFELVVASDSDERAEGELYVNDRVSLVQKTTAELLLEYRAVELVVPARTCSGRLL